MRLTPLGDSAVVIALGDIVDDAMAARVRALATELDRHRPAGVIDIVPAFATIAVFYDVMRIGAWPTFCTELQKAVQRAEASVISTDSRRIVVPVCYGGEFGPDLDLVATHAGLPAREVIAQHSGADYVVHAIGFAPGFPYLGGLPKRLATPRRASPRAEVPAGSVGIGGSQTGVYPLATPGGWNIIGRTPLRLFDPARAEPALLRAGDRVKFQPIAAGEFRADQAAKPAEAPEPAAPPSPTIPGIEVLKAGMFTTVQDLGRVGHRARGVVLAGAADPFALRVANLLVGNAENSAGLEFTLVGPELRFLHDTVVALGGADFPGLPRWKPMHVNAGTILKLGAAQSGCRGYLAFAGGLDVPPVLGSRSTYVRAALGGFGGRAVHDGDVLPVPAIAPELSDHWRIDERIVPSCTSHATVRVIRGARSSEFGHGLFNTPYHVSPQSDRMGVRLLGPALERNVGSEVHSSPVAPGTVQVPADGHPIVLLADAQTIGGYAEVAHVISTDLPLVAQLRPGDSVRFREVSLEEAHALAVAREHRLALLREGLASKLRLPGKPPTPPPPP